MNQALSPLIEQVKLETHPFVVVFVSDAGLRWRAESKAACDVMAKIIGECKVIPRDEFIAMLESEELNEPTN